MYIGHGVHKRAYSKEVRNKSWSSFVEDFPNYVVEVYKQGLSKSEAFALESELILQIKPPLNVKIKQSLALVIDKEEFERFFYIDQSSPSGLRWKVDNNARNPAMKRRLGDVAGSLKYQTDGRPHAWQVMLKGRAYLVHRVIMILKGEAIPEHFVVDHIDRNPLNNSLDNLRIVSVSANNRNTNKSSETGKQGVSKSKCGRYYVVSYSENYIRQQKYFSRVKLGEEAALAAAIAYRKSLE